MRNDDPAFAHALYAAWRLFSGKWMPAISVVLMEGPRNYRDILHRVRALDLEVDGPGRRPVLHEAVLSRTLHRMVGDQLLIRDEIPVRFTPSVVYSLTPMARGALEAVSPMADWAKSHLLSCPDSTARIPRMGLSAHIGTGGAHAR